MDERTHTDPRVPCTRQSPPVRTSTRTSYGKDSHGHTLTHAHRSFIRTRVYTSSREHGYPGTLPHLLHSHIPSLVAVVPPDHNPGHVYLHKYVHTHVCTHTHFTTPSRHLYEHTHSHSGPQTRTWTPNPPGGRCPASYRTPRVRPYTPQTSAVRRGVGVWSPWFSFSRRLSPRGNRLDATRPSGRGNTLGASTRSPPQPSHNPSPRLPPRGKRRRPGREAG